MLYVGFDKEYKNKKTHTKISNNTLVFMANLLAKYLVIFDSIINPIANWSYSDSLEYF